MVGSHPSSLWQRAFEGSMATAVLERADDDRRRRPGGRALRQVMTTPSSERPNTMSEQAMSEQAVDPIPGPGGPPVVVAIAGDGYEAALQYAVEEARRTTRRVHLVHVLMLPAGPYAEVMEDHDRAARSLLSEADARARELSGGEVEVISEVIEDGWLVRSLVEYADRGSTAVLQHRRFGPLHRLVTRSVVNGVAARAVVPVVAVPEGWVPRAGTDPVVTVAIQDPAESLSLIRAAAVAALARGARLVVLHAWWLANGFDVVVVDQGMRADWASRTRTELDPVLAAVRRDFPDLPVTLEVRHGPAAEVLLDAATHCDLIVVGRRHHLLPRGTHLGPVARTVLDRSECPVLMAPEAGRSQESAAVDPQAVLA